MAEYLRKMRKIDPSVLRRHGLDASAFNSSMCFGEFSLEHPVASLFQLIVLSVSWVFGVFSFTVIR